MPSLNVYDSASALEEGYDEITGQYERQQPPQHEAQSDSGVAIKVTVGELIHLNGKEVKLPNGEVVKDPLGNPVKGYGVARIATITVTVGGKPADSSTGITVTEGVELVSAKTEGS